MVTSLLTDRRLRSWLSGAVLTAWSLMLKTVEMIVDFRRHPPALPPLTIMNRTTLQELYLSRVRKGAGKLTLAPSHPVGVTPLNTLF